MILLLRADRGLAGDRVTPSLDIVVFFQAEDGIRDVAVTGVQTCALPISVAFAADLGVVDLRRCRIGDKTETMSGTPGRGCRDGDGDRPDLEEVPGKMVRRVVYAHEALCDVSPLDFNRINPPTHVSKRTVRDRKSTRLNSSHGYISYAVFCLKKKKRRYRRQIGEYLPYHTLQLVPS